MKEAQIAHAERADRLQLELNELRKKYRALDRAARRTLDALEALGENYIAASECSDEEVCEAHDALRGLRAIVYPPVTPSKS